MKDDLNLAVPDDLQRCRKQALKLTHFGNLEGRVPVRIDKRTTIFKKANRNEPKS
ncbi:MAG: hypothetical protein Q8S24_02400 [Eubacteriales bacterium]|nr:hypothetical protein [Eubacteriales bacterium]